MLKIFAVAALAAASLAAQPIDRTKPPQTPPIPGYKLPPISETKLPNGLNLVIAEDSRFPLVTARLNVQAGSKFDPADRPGLAEAVASLLTEGTKTRDARRISEETDSIGGSLGASAGPDSLTVAGSSLSENLSRLLELMADVAMNSSFPENEVNLYKQNRVQTLRAQRSEPAFLAEEKISRLVYGTSPYANIAPTEESIGKLDIKTLAAFRDTYLAPNNATLILIGKLPPRADLMKLLTQRFGAWTEKKLPAPPKIAPPESRKQIVVVDRPGSVQADIFIGRLAPTRLQPDYFPLMVGNSILGGGTNSRMFINIREKEGFAYDAHSEYDANREAGLIGAVTQVRNDVIEPALKALLAELETVSSKPVEARELTDTQNYISGLYLLRLETQEGVAGQLNAVKTLGLPNTYLETYVQRVRAVTPDGILTAAKKYLAPSEAAIVVVGDASKIGDALKKFGNVTVSKAD